ncbi:MAG: hypothetical protein ACRD8Z_02855 [Nitrososphaeraceae archaeon]
MNPTQPIFNLDGFKGICSCRNCDRKPTTSLKIKYLRKIGQFCELCAADLMKADLVEQNCSSEEELIGDG